MARDQRSQGLDGLRALAAFSVMLFHFWAYGEAVNSDPPPTTLGQHVWESARWGLLLFFVLSGFLLYRPWVGAALGARRRPGVARYLRLRAARIAPAYYLALGGAVLIGVLGSSPPMHMPTQDSLPLFAVFAQNFSDHSLRTLDTPMWTLPIELSFYLALPLIGVATLRVGESRRSQVLLTVAIAAIGIAWAHVATGLFFHGVILLQMLPFFALGMAVAVLIQGRNLSNRACRILLGAALAGYLVNLALDSWAPVAGNVLEDIPVAAGFACLVAVGAAGERVPSVLRARSVVWLGVISYGTYLWHQPIMCLLGGHGLLPLNPWLELVTVWPLTVLIAWASWRLIERPVLERAHHRQGPRAQHPAARSLGRLRTALSRPAPALAARRP